MAMFTLNLARKRNTSPIATSLYLPNSMSDVRNFVKYTHDFQCANIHLQIIWSCGIVSLICHCRCYYIIFWSSALKLLRHLPPGHCTNYVYDLLISFSCCLYLTKHLFAIFKKTSVVTIQVQNDCQYKKSCVVQHSKLIFQTLQCFNDM